jgi:hypothetical protein
VDYTRAPVITSTAAIDPLFIATSGTNEAGQAEFPYYWSNTTHANWTAYPGTYGIYVAFGRGMGFVDFDPRT